jgi:intermediate peptidase
MSVNGFFFVRCAEAMMENLFHEFGHAMHSMLAKTRYQHVSGTRCATDFAEVPSQLMEYFCREPSVLKRFAKHYSTREPLSDERIRKLCESKKAFAATDLQLQVLHSKLDQVFHGAYPLTDTPINIIEKYTNSHYGLPFVPNTHWHLRFSHFVGYASKYYSYLVSKAIAAQIWNNCFANDPLNSTAGENYRSKLLAFGGERKPSELINSLIGFNIDNKALVKSICEAI